MTELLSDYHLEQNDSRFIQTAGKAVKCVRVVLMIGLHEIENNTEISDDIINDKEMKSQSNFWE